MTEVADCRSKMKTSSNYKKPLVPVLGVICLLLLPHVAWAEGAVRILDCKVTQVCDAEGTCAAASDEVHFRMEPENLRENGSGEYQISYGDLQASMEATSYAGPFHWTSGMERNTLLASSETRFLWHRLGFNPIPKTDVYFLDCVLQQ